MFYRNKVVSFLVLTLLIGVVTAVAQQQNPPKPRDPGWESVEQAINEGLPKTAIERLTPIIDRALAAKAFDEAVKAIGMRIVFEGNIEGNKPEEKIVRMKAEIAKAPAEMKPVMEAILANWYWQYYQQNRWRFMQRTQSDEAPGPPGQVGQLGEAEQPQSTDDLTTWDLTRILNEIDAQFDKALANAELLQQTPIEQYSRLLEAGSAPVSYRPTMFDVLAHNALDFYSAGEQAALKIQDAFELSADSLVFGSRGDFVSWTPATVDQASPILRAVQLYQALLRFHANDKEVSALLDADLYRLQFGNNHAVGDEKRERFKAALRRFEQASTTHPISARALHLLALEVHGEGDFVAAHKIADEAIARHPTSVGANRCRNLIADIEQPSISATTERVWNDPWPTIDVEYRNVEQVHFRLVKFDFQEFIRSDRWSPEQADPATFARVLEQTPVKAWSAKLPKTADYKARTESTQIPSGLPPGSYYLISSHDESFRSENNYHQLTEVWVGNLALVIRDHQGKGLIEGLVLEAKSGHPIRSARVRAWEREPNQGKLVELTATTSDENGAFRFPPAHHNRLVVHVEHQGMTLSSNSINSWAGQEDGRVLTETRFFTDRAIYRPGQTIHYKGICFSATTKASLRSAVTIVFADPNGKEVERVTHQTNDYGSFSGSVTAPRDRLMGPMSIRVASGPPGQSEIRVEEYKRPKFRVELKAPQEAAKLNAEVKVTGTATAYTGVAISDAKVSWRVVREVQYPIWYWRWWSMPRGESQEIAHGTATTADDGSFSIAFIAKPDATADVDNEPSFRYTITADVTDTTGETRSDASSVNVGYTALRATMTADNWLTTEQPVKIDLLTTSLDDEGRTAKGTVKVHVLKQPAKVIRASLSGFARPFDGKLLSGDAKVVKIESADPNDWELGEVVFESAFETDATGKATLESKLPVGVFRAVLETRDAFGKAVKAVLPLQVIDPKATKLAIKIANVVIHKQRSLEPGETFTAIWGSGYDAARAFVEVEQGGKLLQSYWTKPGVTQATIRQEVTESLRGGFHVRVTMVRENRAYLHSQFVDVPWTNKELSIKWERFTSKLTPGQKEKWVAIVSGKDAERAAAEMVATLYDASLDAFATHSWMSSFGVFQNDRSLVSSRFQNDVKSIQVNVSVNGRERFDEGLTYPRFPDALVANVFGDGYMPKSRMMMRGGMGGGMMMDMAMPAAPMMAMEAEFSMAGAPEGADAKLSILATAETGVASTEPAKPDLAIVSARTNLNETAFFFPHLIAQKDGTVKIEFTMPEALTEWKFLGFAHDTKLRAGLLMDTVVTSKDLMVQPNPPRFLREGDEVEFTVKVSNRSAATQTGTVRLTLADAKTMESVDAKLGSADSDKSFEIAAGASQTFSWRLSVPEGIGFLTYKAVGSTGKISDGEEGFLPVLSKRILVTESIALPIRGKQTKQFDFAKLLASGDSKTLKHESLTVQMVSNPSWYAVLSLPYLMEYPYECNEQTFSRLYANALARHIVTSDPKIERVFEQWRGTPALESPLSKNEDLKSVMLEETPWYAEAQNESQARRNVGVLFDQNRLENEISRAMAKLTESQREDGAWSWFPGGPKNEYMTLYITTGFGRLRHLGVNVDTQPAIGSLATLDAWVKEMRDRKPKPEGITSTIALYLYGRSFFLQDLPIADEYREAVDYWLAQAKEHWLDLPCRQSQAHVAIALKRFGDEATAKAIVASIRERSVSNEEMGMFWRDTEFSWWWYHAPIETQAMMIELFDEVAEDKEAVEACKVWLLKQKQTQDWRTTKATADAIYALLLRGSDLLASNELVAVSLGGVAIVPENVEAGTGFYQERFTRGEVTPTQGSITVTKVDEGVAWGSVHWQYLEDISAVTPHIGTPLTLSKQLFTKQNTAEGPTLSRVDGPVAVGDELVVRIVLKTDRDMEYVHMKDHRGSGTEPVNVLSQYKYQDGLAYYESTRDTASHFFIDYLPKGTYVFEYSTRVQLRGEYQTGVASIQCMYAPEFNSHSESLGIVVK